MEGRQALGPAREEGQSGARRPAQEEATGAAAQQNRGLTGPARCPQSTATSRAADEAGTRAEHAGHRRSGAERAGGGHQLPGRNVASAPSMAVARPRRPSQAVREPTRCHPRWDMCTPLQAPMSQQRHHTATGEAPVPVCTAWCHHQPCGCHSKVQMPAVMSWGELMPAGTGCDTPARPRPHTSGRHTGITGVLAVVPWCPLVLTGMPSVPTTLRARWTELS